MATIVKGDLYESLTGQLFEIGRQLRQQKGYPYNPERLKFHLQDAIEGRFADTTAQPNTECYTITVCYAGNKTLKNLLKEGKYDRVNGDITNKHFPVDKTGTEEEKIYLIHFDRQFDNGDQAVEELDKLGYKPANPAQLLALGVKYPDLQEQFLGRHLLDSDDYRTVIYLRRDSVGRWADLGWSEDGWFVVWRFAAVRK